MSLVGQSRHSDGMALHFRSSPSPDIEPVYSITSSARASSAAGTVMSRAFAVLRLISSSNLWWENLNGQVTGIFALEYFVEIR